MTAIDQVQASAEGRFKAEAAVKASGHALAKAQEKLDGARQQAMAKAKDQVRREIAELRRKQEGVGDSQQATLPISPNVSIAGYNAGNEVAPLASRNGSDIIGEGTQGEAVAGLAARSARNIPVLKTGKDYGDYVIGIANRDDLNLEKKVQYIQEAYYRLEDKTDVNCPSDIRFVKEILTNGYIAYYWPEYYGFVRNNIKPINRDNLLPSLWYRVGPIRGSTFTTMPQNGKVLTTSDLSLPYIDNPDAKHYGTFNTNDYIDVIDAIRDCNLDAMNEIRHRLSLPDLGMNKLKVYTSAYYKFIERARDEVGDKDATYGLMGVVAPWLIDGNVVLSGGAEQISLPFTGDVLDELGLLKVTH